MQSAPERMNLPELPWPQFRDWFVQELRQPQFRAVQVWQWIWQKLARDFDCMSNVSKALRATLTERAEIVWPGIVASQSSSDGTVKFLLEFRDQAQVETVLIPAENRAGVIRWTQCLSTQVGCPMGCQFCATGQLGLQRNMTTGEILGQVLIGRHYLNDTRPDLPILRNLVFMGMGEPLLNTANLIPALQTLGNAQGANFSPRRMTVSTCGIEKGLKELGESGLAYLAVSLHAVSQEKRAQIMPIASRWHLDDMLATLASYPLKTRERITLEYILLGGFNDSLADAKKLARITASIKAKINLIPYNPTPGSPFKAPDPRQVEEFQAYLCSKNITAILRKSKGADIAAACGQLKALNSRSGSARGGQNPCATGRPVCP